MPTVVKPTRRTPPPAPSRARSRVVARRPSPPPKAAAKPSRRGDGTVGWAELAGKATAASARKRERTPGLVDGVPTLRFALMLLAICTALTLYLAHQYASQAVVEEVQELRREKLRLVLQQNRLRGEYDRMTAPAVILRRADELGLRASADYAPTILLTD